MRVPIEQKKRFCVTPCNLYGMYGHTGLFSTWKHTQSGVNIITWKHYVLKQVLSM